MSVQIEHIFTAKAESIWQFLNTVGQGCYIPAYQRRYAWDKLNVDRLIEDVINGLNNLTIRESSLSFLGTVIAIHDTKYVTVSPVFKPEVASRVMTIIDGQQRICTSVMINITIHSIMTNLIKDLEATQGEVYDWLKDLCHVARNDLWATFALDMSTGTPPVYRFYPRVIRALEDVWSKKQGQAKYESPIAKLIWQYIEHEVAKSSSVFEFHPSLAQEKESEKFRAIVDIFDHISRQLVRLFSDQSDEVDFPDLQKVIQKPQFMNGLLSFDPPDSVIEFVTKRSGDPNYDKFCNLMRSLLFYKYFNNRMALTVVTTQSEDDAFDMFEALNTTGEPLTAFETFKPKVIEFEGLSNYPTSSSYDSVLRIEAYLGDYRKADERQLASSEMLIPFALAENGSKIQKNLRDQRRYLRDLVDSIRLVERKRSVVYSLANLASFMRTGWKLSRRPNFVQSQT